ncbi:MAG: sulfite exporter TauE/SafE family protein [Pseudomonadota bacterium]
MDQDFWVLAAVGAAALLAAGSIKGLTGIGLPTASISLMTLALDPRTAIALIIVPGLIVNAWQVWRMGEILRAARDYAVFAGTLAVAILLTTAAAAEAPDRLIFGALGVAVVAFSVINLRFTVPALPARLDRAAQAVLGTVGGVLGGLTAVWAPPLAVYLMARRTPKDEFVRATGLLVFAGSVPLCLGYAAQGLLTAPLAGLSALLVVPALAGFTLGEWLRRDLPGERFRRIFLYIFLAMGLNLLRRALF